MNTMLQALFDAQVSDAERKLRWILEEEGADHAVMVARLCEGEPIQYVLGYTDFMGYRINCDARALIPRPETEQLVDRIIQSIPPPTTLIDVCTGTGCIAIALKKAFPEAQVIATDISGTALELARENAALHQVDVAFQEKDLLEGCEARSADLIVSNPPYIASSVIPTLANEVKNYEPRLALDGGADGLDVIQILVAQAAEVLRWGGPCFLEMGDDQGEAIRTCMQSVGFEAHIQKDLAEKPRFAIGRLIKTR